jgi:hypothetical protein
MDGARALLVVLLVVNGVQAGLAAAAFIHGGARARRDELRLAHYSRRHAQLLLAAGAVLSILPVLGLAGVLSARLALWVSIVAEAAAFTVGRRVLEGLHAKAHGSPGSTSPATPAPTTTAAEGASETADS